MEKLIRFLSFDYGDAIQFIKNHRLAVASATAVALYGAWYLKRPRNLPPGPYGIPVFGSLFSFNASSLKQLKEKYGDVYCLWFGGNRYWVFLNSYEAAKEAFVTRGETFMHRNKDVVIDLAGMKDTLFNSPYNDTYKLSRKIGAQALRNLIKTKLEITMADEIDTLDEIITQNNGKLTDLHKHVQRIYANTILELLFSLRYKHGERDLDAFINNTRKWFEKLGIAFVAVLVPGMLKILLSRQIAEVRKLTRDITDFIENKVEQHISTFDENDIRDIVDHYLKEGAIEKFGKEEFCGTCLNFIPDAVNTASDMLIWCIIYMMNYPSYQKTVFEEIKSITLSSRVSLADRTKMPVTEAFIMEVFRHVKPAAFTPEHMPKEDTTFRGYNIPSYVNVIVNLSAILSDPKIFPEPNAFKPERFIQNGELKSIDGFIPFSTGRRMCIGEQLARSETFLVLANLVQKYELKSPGGILPSLEPDKAQGIEFIVSPRRFEVVFELRQ